MSVFTDEWRECLREHYKAVVREQDHVTLKSLVKVMYTVGFTDDDLNELKVLATMRADEMPQDFMPDLDIMEGAATPTDDTSPGMEDFQPHPLECQCPSCVEINLQPHDADGQPLEVEDEVEKQARLAEERESLRKEDDDQGKPPKQLSMF